MIGSSHVSSRHVVIAAVIVLVLVLVISHDQEAIAEFTTVLVWEVGFVLLPVGIIFLIEYLSSGNRSAAAVNVPKSDASSIHRASGSPVGVFLVIALVLLLLYYKGSVFGGGDDASGD